MTNEELTRKDNELNPFTKKLKEYLDKHGKVLCHMRNGFWVEVANGDQDKDGPTGVGFKSYDSKINLRWSNRGQSATSVSYDLISCRELI
jgi:hypothetical protein